MQRLKLDINPKGEIPVLYASQCDKGRLFEVELVEGDQAYNVPLEYSVQINVRKTDSKLVTAAPKTIVDNILTFATTEQMTACAGENIASITLKDADDFVITTLYFLISVQRDVLAGGLNSASEIHNLEEQIASIVPEVIGDDYYNKTETDALLANKANMSDLASLASKAELTQAIVEEDAAVKDWVSSHFATPGYVADRYYNKTQVDELLDNIFPTLTASGAIASFITALNKPLVGVTHEAGATTITRCGANFVDFNLESYSDADEFWLPQGNYYCSLENASGMTTAWYFGAIKKDGTYCTKSELGLDDWSVSGGGYCYGNADKDYFAFSIPADVSTIKIGRLSAGGTIGVMINIGSSAVPYEAYNGQTVTVADATSLTTLSGVNNVFADEGDVTVQYKYMSL